MSELNAAQLDELERLEKAATPGPWHGDRYDGTVKYEMRGADEAVVLVVQHKSGEFGFLGDQGDYDESLVMALRNAAPQLIAAARRVAELEDEVHEWEESDAAAVTLGPTMAELEAALKERDARITELERNVKFTQQWYAERWQTMHDFFRSPEMYNTEACNKWFSIVANGTATHSDPPTYGQQLNLTKHRAERAEAALAERTAERDAAREDTARLDWLERHAHCCDQFGSGSGDHWWNVVFNDGHQADGSTPRQAIDAARAKQEGK